MMEVQRTDYDAVSLKPEEKYSQRKSKKPLMEKRRRARINNCLLQLKSLVLQAMKKDTSHYSKLEKADILEMTVKHLRTLQRRQISSAVAADPTVAAKYNVGFSECANEVMRYLGNAQGINEDIRHRMLNHLGNCLQTMHNPAMTSSMTSHHTLQPIHVQIPSAQSEHVPLYSAERLLVPSTPSQSNVGLSLQKNVHTPSNGQTTGAFELVPGSAFNGQVAFYIGQSQCDNSNIYSVQTPPKPSASPELKSAVRCQTGGSPSSSFRQQYSTENTGQFISTPLKASHVSNAVPGYSSVFSALKDEKLWRPW